ncbi:molybdate ABC transporter substrate-binding protein [Tundrisphaera lichenicola]|uniref:molybdate ABC transporter substrate-binding protein n=1 Tax=Tundrisphaera lichenicola TaxID=2029860 RepID=UPI003EC05A13
MAWIRVFLGIAIACFIQGCGSAEPDPSVLRVAAASDLEHVLPVLASAFRSKGGVEVVPSFGSSGQLAEQIRQGAPFDLFLSADRRFVERLADEGAIRPGSVKPYARGSLILALKADSPLVVKGLADLAQSGIKFVAIANPETAPYGRAAKQAMERAGIYQEVQTRLVQAGSVRQALQMVQSGNAEVGIVGRSIADAKGIRWIPLPLDSSDPIDQYLGVVARSGRVEEASKLAEFLLSEDGRGILKEFGFGRVPDAPGGSK